MSWRDGAAKTPQHGVDLAVTDAHSAAVTAALRAAFTPAVLRAAIAAAQTTHPGTVTKAVDPATTAARDAAKRSLADVTADELDAVLRKVLADAYQGGANAAALQLQIGGTADWEPGDAAAADLVNDGGLADLLDSAGVSVKGITNTLVDQLGNRIGDGLASGASVDDIAGTLAGIVDDPDRAEMIAHTETARAVTTATLDSYEANGVGQWEWILSDDACPECEDAADAGPYAVGDDGDRPPLHPRCRCSSSPVADSIDADRGDADGSDDVADDSD